MKRLSRTNVTLIHLWLIVFLTAGCCLFGSKPKVEEWDGNKRYKGIASWYGEKYHGRKTSNGETYNMHSLTAAHRSIPFNSIVEVKNLENGKKVVVRINDRGPFVKGRIIDLSYAAAKRIDSVEAGIVKVRLKIIHVGDQD